MSIFLNSELYNVVCTLSMEKYIRGTTILFIENKLLKLAVSIKYVNKRLITSNAVQFEHYLSYIII